MSNLAGLVHFKLGVTSCVIIKEGLKPPKKLFFVIQLFFFVCFRFLFLFFYKRSGFQFSMWPE